MLMRLFSILALLALGGALTAPHAWAESHEGSKKPKAETSQNAKESEKPEGGEEEEGGKGKKKKGEQTITGGEKEGDPVYVHLQPVVLPVIDERGAQQIVTMLVDLQVKDFDTATRYAHEMPKVRDAVLQALYGGLTDGSRKNSYTLDFPAIKSKVRGAMNKLFGDNSVEDVLIQAVSQRKL